MLGAADRGELHDRPNIGMRRDCSHSEIVNSTCKLDSQHGCPAGLGMDQSQADGCSCLMVSIETPFSEQTLRVAICRVAERCCVRRPPSTSQMETYLCTEGVVKASRACLTAILFGESSHECTPWRVYTLPYPRICTYVPCPCARSIRQCRFDPERRSVAFSR